MACTGMGITSDAVKDGEFTLPGTGVACVLPVPPLWPRVQILGAGDPKNFMRMVPPRLAETIRPPQSGLG